MSSGDGRRFTAIFVGVSVTSRKKYVTNNIIMYENISFGSVLDADALMFICRSFTDVLWQKYADLQFSWWSNNQMYRALICLFT